MALHWQLLGNDLQQLAKGRSWRDLWLEHVHNAEQGGKLSKAQQAALMGLYKHYQQATMDFEQLQDGDMLSELCCTCDNPHTNLICDGVAVSCLLRNMHLQAAHYPRLGDVHVVRGSKFQDRVHVRAKSVRDALWKFTEVARGGGMQHDGQRLCKPMSGADFTAMQADLHSAAAMSHFIQAVAVQVRSHCCDVMRRLMVGEVACFTCSGQGLRVSKQHASLLVLLALLLCATCSIVRPAFVRLDCGDRGHYKVRSIE